MFVVYDRIVVGLLGRIEDRLVGFVDQFVSSLLFGHLEFDKKARRLNE